MNVVGLAFLASLGPLVAWFLFLFTALLVSQVSNGNNIITYSWIVFLSSLEMGPMDLLKIMQVDILTRLWLSVCSWLGRSPWCVPFYTWWLSAWGPYVDVDLWKHSKSLITQTMVVEPMDLLTDTARELG